MNQTKNKANYSQNIWNFIRNISKAIVSGIPTEKVDLKPRQKIVLHIKEKEINSDTKKHYHRPVAKPVVEKQTLLKDKKKVKGSQKS